MTNIKVVVKNGLITIEIDGHAGYAEHGHDIVCAAISAISHTAILGLNAVAAQYPEYAKIKIEQS